MNRSARLGFKVTFGILICRVLIIISHLRIPELCIMNGSRINNEYRFFLKTVLQIILYAGSHLILKINSCFQFFLQIKTQIFFKGKIVHSIK